MERNYSYKGNTAVFTGRPSAVPGGFTLDYESQNFREGDVIPAGTLAIYDDFTRKVKIIKTGKVFQVQPKTLKYVDPETLEETLTPVQVIKLQASEFHQSNFVKGEKILKTVSGSFADAPTIIDVIKFGTFMILTISPVIAGLDYGDTIVQVVDKDGQAALIGDANGVTFYDVEIKDKYSGVGVVHDTKEHALYEKRVLPIPESQKDSTGLFLKANPHIKLTQLK